MSEELPYKTEYAKSGRSHCQGCKRYITQGALRLAVVIQVICSYQLNHLRYEIYLLEIFLN